VALALCPVFCAGVRCAVAARQLKFGPQIVQVPLERAVERHAGADEPLAVIDQQPQIKFRAGQLGARQRLDPGSQRGPGDRDRVDPVGLATLAACAP
jgi:hypothetical protein